jgi:hypothetical protein
VLVLRRWGDGTYQTGPGPGLSGSLCK